MFYGEFLEKLKIENSEVLFPRITVSGKVGVSVEGHRGLLFFADTEVRFRIKGGILSVTGENLKLYETGNSEAYVAGRISAVSYA